MAIINLKHGFTDGNDGETVQTMLDINMMQSKSPAAKKAFNKFADFVTGTENKAQIQTFKTFADFDFEKLKGKQNPEDLEKPLAEKADELVQRFSTVDSDARNKLVDLFKALVNADNGILTINDRNIIPIELDDLSAVDEVAIAAQYAVLFMQS